MPRAGLFMQPRSAAALLVLALAVSGCSAPALRVPPTQTSTSPTDAAGYFRVHYVNVTQGDGTIWEFPDGTLLVYDCGPAWSSPETNPVTRYLRDVLHRPFGSTLWGLVASHGHLDHIGGCQEVFSSYELEHVYDVWYQGNDRPQSYETFQEEATAEGAQLHTLLDDPHLDTDARFHQWDTLPLPATAGVAVQILWPPDDYQGNDWDEIADNSLVLRASHGSVDFCFQGDIETAQENTLAGYPQDLDCDVYLMGHHGSKYASGTTWLGKMHPQVAPVSFGENSYGHPTPEALCRVQQAGAKVYATGRLGNITITSGGDQVTVSPDGPETKDYCAAGASYWA
jgi:competence protein ComEC